jgi:hypothetical protein
MRANILRILTLRFGPELPTDLIQVVQAREDRATLDRWFDLALTVVSLDQARAAFGLGNGA